MMRLGIPLKLASVPPRRSSWEPINAGKKLHSAPAMEGAADVVEVIKRPKATER
jgi:hypothetical protein